MPSWRLTQVIEKLVRYTVIATDAERAEGQGAKGPRPIRHVGILSDDTDVRVNQQVLVHHMAPPVEESLMLAHAVGLLDRIDADQWKGIEEWLFTVQTEMAQRPIIVPAGASRRAKILAKFRDYVIRPAVKKERDATSGRDRCLGFSCSGFVHECFAEGAGVVLVDESHMPRCDESELEPVWGALRTIVPKEEQDTWLGERGLVAGEDWRVLLPSYLLHAFRSAPALPLAPADEHKVF